MFPKYHLLFGLIFSIVLLMLFPSIELTGFFIIVSSSVLIDVDHYLYYVFKKRDLSLKNAHRWFHNNIKKYESLSLEHKKQVYSGVFFLHGIESIILLILLSSHMAIFLFILIGFIFHQILDFIDIIQKRIKPYKVISFAYSIKETRNKKLVDEI
ncbi:MAG: hypothetical protein Q7R52_04635 [archaeon]|nr:hypothetical protein [archaeon]